MATAKCSSLRVNRSAVERRAATLGTWRTVKKDWQAAWLLRAVTCLDLTNLAGDDTSGNVLRLCAKACLRDTGEGPKFLREATQVKNIWTPSGE